MNIFRFIEKTYYLVMLIYSDLRGLISSMDNLTTVLTGISADLDNFRTENEKQIKDVAADVDTLNQHLLDSGESNPRLLELANNLKAKVASLSDLNTELQGVADKATNASPTDGSATGSDSGTNGAPTGDTTGSTEGSADSQSTTGETSNG